MKNGDFHSYGSLPEGIPILLKADFHRFSAPVFISPTKSSATWGAKQGQQKTPLFVAHLVGFLLEPLLNYKYIYIYLYITILVGGFNPSEKY